MSKQFVFPTPPKGYQPISRRINEDINQDLLCLYQELEGGALAKLLLRGTEDEKCMAVSGLICTQRWLETGAKIVYPDESIVEACKETEVLETVSGADIKVVFPYMCFHFPPNFRGLVHGEELAIQCAILAFHEDETTPYNIGGQRFEYKWPAGRFLQCLVYFESKQRFIFNVDMSSSEPISKFVAEVAENVYEKGAYRVVTEPNENVDMTPCSQIVEVILNMLLVMQSYPEYLHNHTAKIRTGGKTRAVTTHKLQLPSKLQQQVRGRRSGLSSSQESAVRVGETYAKWWKGHWRRQIHGAKWAAEHPGVAVISFPDEQGNPREAHLQWILPSLRTLIKGREYAVTADID